MSPHTPGPWEVDDGALGATPEEPFTQPGALGVFAEDGQRICYLSEEAGHPDGLRGRDEDEANARLIAAAPDLLTACEAAVTVHDSFRFRRAANTGGRADPDPDYIAAARAAIKMARGA